MWDCLKIGYAYIWLTIITVSLWRYTPFSDPKFIVGQPYLYDINILSPLSHMKIAILVPVDSIYSNIRLLITNPLNHIPHKNGKI